MKRLQGLSAVWATRIMTQSSTVNKIFMVRIVAVRSEEYEVSIASDLYAHYHIRYTGLCVQLVCPRRKAEGFVGV